jgi:hypothetical protein
MVGSHTEKTAGKHNPPSLVMESAREERKTQKHIATRIGDRD